MLRHQQQEEETSRSAPAVPNAAQQRVTPEELTAALAALEARQEEEAQRVRGTIPIGEAIQELGLNVTPEEVWRQVEAQRAPPQVMPPEAPSPAHPPPGPPNLGLALSETVSVIAQEARKVAVQASAVAQERLAQERLAQERLAQQVLAASRVQAAVRARRPMRRSFGRRRQRSGGGGLVVLLALAVGGWVWFSNGHGLVVSSSNTTRVYDGDRQAAVVNGSGDDLTLVGDCGTLVVNGSHCRVTVTGTLRRVIANGSDDVIIWGVEQPDHPPAIVDNGDRNQIQRQPAQ